MFKTYKLQNGLRVIAAPLHETKAMTALVLVKVGSRYERHEINGASHFVEHLMFKGTTKRPTALSISKELDGIGAEYNAFTSKDHTGYYIKASANHSELALDVLSDIVFNSTFDEREVERERGVIIEEINMYEDNPMMFMEDLFEETVYGDHPLGWNIAGPKAVIRQVKRHDLLSYYQRYYQPKNMLLAIAGQLDERTPLLVEKFFGARRASQTKWSFKPAHSNQREPHLKLKHKETEQAQLALGFPAYSYFDEKLYPLYLLSVILGGNMSSRLFMSIREKKGLCYFIRATVNVYEDTGNFMVQAGLDKLRISEAIREILKELRRVVQGGVTSGELVKAKEYLKGKLILDLEASDNVASWLSKQQLLRGKILTVSQQIARLEAVNRDQIRRVASDVIRPSRLNLALIGPFKQEAEFRSLLKF